MAEETVMRRMPKQKRGQQRVTQILDAAARLIAYDGYENVSTNAIAEEAHTSIGSLYQFFPNKDAVYLALAERYVVELNDLLAEVVTSANESLSLPDQFDSLLDQLAVFYKDNPGFQPLFFGTYKTAVITSGEAVFSQMVAGMAAILAQHTAVPAPQRERQAAIIVYTLKSTLPLIATDDETENQAALLEIKRMMRGYLAALI
jgi:AcrR family transcriptional regulator